MRISDWSSDVCSSDLVHGCECNELAPAAPSWRWRRAMTAATVFEPGGYAYLPGVFQYSAGVAALPGFRIERVCFPAPIPLADGFEWIAETIQAAGRPLTDRKSTRLNSSH